MSLFIGNLLSSFSESTAKRKGEELAQKNLETQQRINALKVGIPLADQEQREALFGLLQKEVGADKGKEAEQFDQVREVAEVLAKEVDTDEDGVPDMSVSQQQPTAQQGDPVPTLAGASAQPTGQPGAVPSPPPDVATQRPSLLGDPQAEAFDALKQKLDIETTAAIDRAEKLGLVEAAEATKAHEEFDQWAIENIEDEETRIQAMASFRDANISQGGGTTLIKELVPGSSLSQIPEDSVGNTIDPEKRYKVAMNKRGEVISVTPVLDDQARKNLVIKDVNLGDRVRRDFINPLTGEIVKSEVMIRRPTPKAPPSTEDKQKLGDYVAALIAFPDFQWQQVPQGKRASVAALALENDQVILTKKQREDLTALSNAGVVMQQTWDIVTKDRGYDSTEEFLAKMDAYKETHDDQLPEGFGGVGQRLTGLYKAGLSLTGFGGASVTALEAQRELLAPFLARSFGERGNIAVSEREAAKKSIVSISNTDAEVYRLISSFKGAVDGIKSKVTKQATDFMEAARGGAAVGGPEAPVSEPSDKIKALIERLKSE